MSEITIWLFVLAISISCYSETITRSDGRDFTLGEWTPPVPLAIPAANGESITVGKRTNTITEPDKFRTRLPLVFLHHAATHEAWLALPYDEYFWFQQRIYGVRVSGTALEFISSTAVDALKSDDQNIHDRVTSILEKPYNFTSIDSTKVRLEEIFGMSTFAKPLRSEFMNLFRITSVRVENSSITIVGDTLATNRIEVTLDRELNVQRARKNGAQVLLLSRGHLSRTLPITSPAEISIPSGYHEEKVLFGAGIYSYRDQDQKIQEQWISAAVNPKTGGVCFGLDHCYFAILLGKLYGAIIDYRSGDLLLFKEYGQIDLTGDTVQSFQNMQREICEAFSRGDFKESKRIVLKRLPSIGELGASFRKFDVRDSLLRVVAVRGNRFHEILLNKDLKLVSPTEKSE